MREWAEAFIAAVLLLSTVAWCVYTIVWAWYLQNFYWLYLLNTDVLSGHGQVMFTTEGLFAQSGGKLSAND